jgi:hypothetical protein
MYYLLTNVLLWDIERQFDSLCGPYAGDIRRQFDGLCQREIKDSVSVFYSSVCYPLLLCCYAHLSGHGSQFALSFPGEQAKGDVRMNEKPSKPDQKKL